ncbi:MAG: dihydroorotate dehydrogenase electron transfer subunit [Atopobiaceae bacterium]|nr:dihydroorotate dehydrogenase electron transfer subunit [Atopobiaceae bacterium]MCI2173273.1 dihydroorotate dehydrogenase electron transfer subunit [Atopobiaceae bacterium]MCI2207268.1 dihydroorotate dehydrogenase electron transfer subunit [Atopobiaceae bacterium]
MRAPKLAEGLSSGQFMSIAVPGDATQLVRVPLSFSKADPVKGTVETEYAVVGDGTRRLSLMRPGDTSDVLGPGGHGWRLESHPRRVLLVAGGIGITPIVSAARWLAREGVEFDAIVGTKTVNTLWGFDELMSVGVQHVVITSDDGTAGDQGFTTDALEPALAGGEYDLVLTCGPEVMMHKVADICAAVGVACEVSMERMMTCGFGACATCVVPTRSGNVGACMGGPVFDAKEVVW